ncbi:MAG: hypothetical protein ACPF9M_05415 [Candidatus Puniceispirillaceae bacterium]
MKNKLFYPFRCSLYLMLLLFFAQASSAAANCKPFLHPDKLGENWRITDQIKYADTRLGYGIEFHHNGAKFTLYSFDLGMQKNDQPPLRSMFHASETAIGTELKKYNSTIRNLEPWQVPEQFLNSTETLEFASVTPLVAPNNFTLSFLGMGRRENCVLKMRLTSKVKKIDRTELLGFTSFAVNLIAKTEKGLMIQ